MRGVMGLCTFFVLSSAAAGPAIAQTNIVHCVPVAATPVVRSEGHAELIGDISLTCSGGNPDEVRFINLVLFLNANITSNLTGSEPNESEALLLIDDPRPGVLNMSNGVTYDGQVKGTPSVLPGTPGGPGAPDSGNVYTGFRPVAYENRLEWNGIPFRPAPAGDVRSLRIVNVRTDTSAFAIGPNQPEPLVAKLGASLLPAMTSEVVVGYVVPGLKAGARNTSGRFELVFEEQHAEAFRKRIENSTAGIGAAVLQSTPEVDYYTESGFTPEFGGTGSGEPGAANTGTRLVAQFNDLPSGVFMTAPSSVAAGDRNDSPTQLEARRVVNFDANMGGGVLLGSGAPEELVPVSNGQATIVYEVVALAPFAQVNGALVRDVFRIPVQVVFGQPVSLGNASVALALGPLNGTRVMSKEAPEPRFFVRDESVNVFPVVAGHTLDYVTMRFTPSDATPVHREKRFEDNPVLEDSVMVIEGEPWLSANIKPRTSEVVEFSADPEGLEAGRYQGAVALRFEATPEALSIVPVIFDVSPPPEILVNTAPIWFRMDVGGPPPSPQTLFLNGRNKWLRYTIETSTTSGGNWLSVTPDGGQTPVNLTVHVDSTGLGSGRYEGEIEILAEAASNSPQLVPVTLEVVPPLPAFPALGVVNSASYVPGGVSPGEIITIFGDNLGPEETAGLQIGPDGKVTTETGGTRILFNGVPAPMIAASKLQSSCVVPYFVGGLGEVEIVVEADGWPSGPAMIPVMTARPGVFSADASGTGHGAIANQDGTLNSPANPAPVDSVITLYMTGVGETLPAGEDGRLNSSANPPVPLELVVVRIGGVESTVEFVGGAPNMVAGAIQLNVRVPYTPGDEVPLQILVGGRSANIVYMSVGL